MKSSPRISVVMAVYNGARDLDESIRSISMQSFADWEMIVVNDGSTDDTESILSARRQLEPRLIVLAQPNRGLTRALIEGCKVARGEFIARLDCGDISKPERLLRQLQLLESDKDAVLASCGVAIVGPNRRTIGESHMVDDIEPRLKTAGEFEIRSLPAHSSAFFRRSAYEAAGGYREQFYFAQDLDLWTRMVKLGRFITTREILLEFAIDPESISAHSRKEQIALAAVIVQLRDAKTAESSRLLLAKASTIRQQKRRFGGSSAGLYFLSQLLSVDDPERRKYLLAALRENPFHWKAALRLLQESMRRWTR